MVTTNNLNNLPVFPTPASDYLTINSADTAPAKAVLCNMMRAVLMNINVQSGKRIDIRRLPAGIFLLKTEGRTLKVIKE